MLLFKLFHSLVYDLQLLVDGYLSEDLTSIVRSVGAESTLLRKKETKSFVFLEKGETCYLSERNYGESFIMGRGGNGWYQETAYLSFPSLVLDFRRYYPTRTNTLHVFDWGKYRFVFNSS